MNSVGQASGSVQKGPAFCHTLFRGVGPLKSDLLAAGWARALLVEKCPGQNPNLTTKSQDKMKCTTN